MDLDQTPGYLIRRFQQIAVAIFLAEVEEAGFDLTPVQFGALTVTEANPGIDQATLAGLIAYDRTTIGGVVARLVQKGYVSRDVSDRDRRARVLHVTEAGAHVLRAAEPAVRNAQRLMLAGLDPDEAQELVRLLGKAIASSNGSSRAPMLERQVADR